MIIGISGYTLTCNHIFSNGYTQNIIFFCKMIKKWFVEHTIIEIIDSSFIDKYTNIDIIIQFSPFNKELSNIIYNKYPKCKNIFVKYGHEYYNDLMRLLPTGENLKNCASKAYNIDEVWISPHFESTKYYYESIYNATVKIIPYIWQPENIYIKPFIVDDFHCEKNIYIIEPNINMFKTSLIPILIVNELWKKNPNSFNKLYIISNNNYDKNKYFRNELLYKIPVLHSCYNKTYFCNRANMNDIFKQPGVLLSHQENCGLNYIYLEALYLRIPWVHNSTFLKNVGYFYMDKNIPEGVIALKDALDEFKPVNNMDILEKYNPDNPNVIMEYKKLINHHTQMKIKLGNYNRKKSWYSYTIPKYIIDKVGGYILPEDIIAEKNETIISIESTCNVNKQKIMSFVISVDKVKMQDMKQKIETDYIFIDMDIFPKGINKIEKHKMVGFSHMKCWIHALELNLNHIFVFEDDVVFIKNWRNVVNKFIQENQPNIIKFDALSYRCLPESDNINFYLAFEQYCMGGYYITKEVMKYGIQLFNSIEWTFNSCEDFFKLVFQKFESSLYTSVPRICIQEWFNVNNISSIQDDTHIQCLKNMQIDYYLPKYGHFYGRYNTMATLIKHVENV